MLKFMFKGKPKKIKPDTTYTTTITDVNFFKKKNIISVRFSQPQKVNGCKWCGGELVVKGQTECDSCHELVLRLRCMDPKLVAKIVIGIMRGEQ